MHTKTCQKNPRLPHIESSLPVARRRRGEDRSLAWAQSCLVRCWSRIQQRQPR